MTDEAEARERWKREMQQLIHASRADDTAAVLAAARSKEEYGGVPVRAKAAQMLGRIGDVSAGPHLVELLEHDESEFVRFRAAQSLSAEWPDAREALWGAVRRDGETDLVRFTSLAVLAGAGDEDAAQEAARVVREASGAMRDREALAIRVLVESRDTRHLEVLRQRLRRIRNPWTFIWLLLRMRQLRKRARSTPAQQSHR
jgi:HEAT repeat protein